jgi:AcrR family transcriptional regulator
VAANPQSATRSPPRKGRRPRRSGAQRQAEILAAARQEFIRSGYAGTSVRDIARVADVNEAMLYRFFESKDDLFEAAVAEPLEEAVVAAFAPAAKGATVLEVSEAFVANLLRTMEEIAPLLTVVLSDAERGQRFYREHFEPAVERLERGVEKNIDKWEHRDFDWRTAIKSVFGMCLFMALDARFGSEDRRADLVKDEPEVFRLIFDGLRRRPEDDDVSA